MKKKMYKVKKRWVIASATVLAIASAGLASADEQAPAPAAAPVSENSSSPQLAPQPQSSQQVLKLEEPESVSNSSTSASSQVKDSTPAETQTGSATSVSEISVSDSEVSRLESATVQESPQTTGKDQALLVTPSSQSQPASVATTVAKEDDVQASAQVAVEQGEKGFEIKAQTQGIEDLSQLRFAVWSENNGQDDLHWYAADGKGTAIADYKNHAGYGQYQVHTYLHQDGGMRGLAVNTFTVAKPKVETKVTQKDQTHYEVSVTKVPAYISKISVPVWSDKKDQDDLVWYPATKVGEGIYQANIDLKNHNFEKGHYTIHLYGDSQLDAGKQGFVGKTDLEVKHDIKAEKPEAKVSHRNPAAGTLRVDVKETPLSKLISSIDVAAWSQAQQENLHWYQAKPVDGQASITIDQALHGYQKGDYKVHAYVTFKDGSKTGYDLGTYRLESEKKVGYFVDISSHNGDISVADFNRLKSQGITGVVIKLTEGTNYLNPYAKSQIANAQAAGMKVSAYHFSQYATADQARAEATYFANTAQSLGLDKDLVMVNDLESDNLLTDVNGNTQAWTDTMKSLGYSNLVYYTMASWLDSRGGQLNTAQLGWPNLWVAHYINGYTYLSQEEAQNHKLYPNAAAWQYTSVSTKLKNYLDENIDYTRRMS